MYDNLLIMAAGFWSAIDMMYWACLIIGGGLLVFSTLGSFDTDLVPDMDLDVDLDSGSALAAGSLAAWFSMHFVVFFMTMFGLMGVVFTRFAEYGQGMSLGIALFGGLLVGQGAHQVYRRVKKNSGNSTPKLEDYTNKVARVTVGIGSKDKGEISIRVGRTDRFVSALARHERDRFDPGQQVGVVDYRDGVAEVVSKEEFEFLSESSRNG